MSGRVSQRNEKTSVKHRRNLLEVAFVEHANFDNLRKSGPHSFDRLSTADLISAVGYAWDCAKKPLSTLVSKREPSCKTELIKGDGVLNYSNNEETIRASNLVVDQPLSHNLNITSISSRLVQENFENFKVKHKLSYLRTIYEVVYYQKTVPARSTPVGEPYPFSCIYIPSNLGSIYRWMTEVAPTKQMNQVDSVKIESKKASDCRASEFLMNSGTGTVPTDTISTYHKFTVQPLDLSFGKDLKESTMTCSENNIVHDQHIDETDSNNLASVSHECENSRHEHQIDQGVVAFDEVNSSEIEISLSGKEISPYALANHEHAFAGAMAGVTVSFCLHPIDTIKTVIQSCHVDRKPLHEIGRSIIAERGISGLYRGISSNIVASAPISAVYTFTYESVKKSLLPVFPKEYHSLAHCTAGGCASIATSFIFTPSERIKQQMQIGSHYRNCWSAFMQVIEKGGVLSLYTGWSAVLCRNVPHSAIKFYTYECLRQTMSPSTKSNAQANLVATLVCGGLAGSMASLFTTPFDVVKTRLQTQIPGSMTRYSGVFNTLTGIGKQEGLKGLYRGLTPRLVMYMIQGALFFASYESFKRLFSLEA